MGTPRICGVFLYTILKKCHAYGYIKKSDAGRSTGRLPWWSRGYIKWLWMAAGRPDRGGYHHQTTQHIRSTITVPARFPSLAAGKFQLRTWGREREPSATPRTKSLDMVLGNKNAECPPRILKSYKDTPHGRSAGIRTRGLLDPKIRLKIQRTLSDTFVAVYSGRGCFPNLSAPMSPSASAVVWVGVWV